jgi:hypothetical protein
MPNSTKRYFKNLGKRILESLDEDPEIEPGQADTTPGNADTEAKEPEKKPPVAQSVMPRAKRRWGPPA